MSERTLSHYLDELQISTAIIIPIFFDTPKQVLPMRDFFSTWKCYSCGAQGKHKVKFKSTLRTRVRAHQQCRCKAWIKQ